MFEPSTVAPLCAAFSSALGSSSDFSIDNVHRSIARAIAMASTSSNHLFASLDFDSPPVSWPAYAYTFAAGCAARDRLGRDAPRATVSDISDLLAALEAFTDAHSEAPIQRPLPLRPRRRHRAFVTVPEDPTCP